MNYQKLAADLNSGKTNLAVVGLGYVGLPLLVAFAEHFNVIGFDINKAKVAKIAGGTDVTGEVGDAALKAAIDSGRITFSSDAADLKKANFIVVAVPTPINGDKTPDLMPVRSASELVGANLAPNSLVVFESTVYPGVTEEICAETLAEKSGLKLGEGFSIGYSPERINPADQVHRLKNIVKIVSGIDEETLDLVADVYGKIIEAGVYRAPTVKVAEAAKLVENSQRDINIAFMNELAIVFDKMGIDTNEVIKAMQTKWNALPFVPGLVGGHCIGVDPYYFIYEAEKLGYHSEIIAAGRRVNDGMGKFIAEVVVREIIKAKIDASRAKVYLLGMTFKENCADCRNSRPADVYFDLLNYGIEPIAVDPVADKDEFFAEYGIELADFAAVGEADCLVYLVRHDAFKADAAKLRRYFKAGQQPLVIDVKGLFAEENLKGNGFIYWSL